MEYLVHHHMIGLCYYSVWNEAVEGIKKQKSPTKKWQFCNFLIKKKNKSIQATWGRHMNNQTFYIAVCDDVKEEQKEIAEMTEEICKVKYQRRSKKLIRSYLRAKVFLLR